MNDEQINEKLQSPERRKALKAVAKYSTVLVGSSLVVLSSADAVKAQSYSACSGPAAQSNPNCQ